MTAQPRLHVSGHPLIRHKLAALRDTNTEPKEFRALVRELALLLAYEATSDLAVEPTTVSTPLGEAVGFRLKERIGLAPILRAGLGMVEGMWELLPGAEVWHIGLYRDHKTLQPVHYYSRLPPQGAALGTTQRPPAVTPTVQVCLVLDPMLATGGSAVATVGIIKEWGAKRIKFVGIIAAPEGIRALAAAHPDVDIHVAAVDECLTPPPSAPEDPPEGYIVPGLGDAGDRQFGTE